MKPALAIDDSMLDTSFRRMRTAWGLGGEAGREHPGLAAGQDDALACRDWPAFIGRTRAAQPGLSRNLFAQAMLKNHLLATMPPEEAAALFAVTLDDRLPPRLRCLSVTGMYEHLRQENGLHLLIPDDPFEVRSPRTTGGAARTTTDCPGRVVFAGQVRDAVIRHRCSFVETAGRLLLDFQKDERDAIPLMCSFDPLVFEDRGAEMLVLDHGGGARRRLAEALYLGGATSYAFGHWLGEYLPKWLGAVRSGLARDIPIVIDGGMPAAHREALLFFGGPDLRLVELPPGGEAHVSRLWVLGNWAYAPVLPLPGQSIGPKHVSIAPPAWTSLQGWLWDGREMPPRPREKLFLARAETLHRKLRNQDRIAALAQEAGFRVVHMEDHPFAEQVGMIRSAEAIAGPDGSAFLLGLYACPGTQITILSHPFVENMASLTSLFECLGMDTLLVEGPCVRENELFARFSDYEIDEEAFLEAITRSGGSGRQAGADPRNDAREPRA